MVEQGFFAPRADAGDFVKGIAGRLFFTCGAVGANGKAMGFVAQALQII